MADVQASFIVSINHDGTLTTQAITENVERIATTYDIYQSTKKLSEEIDGILLADRISQAVIAALQPKDPSAEQRARMADALSERGIDPTNV